MGDDSFDRGEVIYTFDGDAAGQAAALKAFDGDQSFAAQTFVCVAPDGQDPCELRQSAGDTAVRDLVARREPLFEFAIRSILREHDLDTRRGPGRGAAAHACRWSPGSSARTCATSTPAGSRAGPSWDDIAMVVRRVRETRGGAGRAVAQRPGPPRRPPPRDDPRLHRQREALKAALQVPAIAGPGYDELPEQAFTPPGVRCRCTGRCRRRAGCAAAARARRGWTPWSPSARRRSGGWSPSWRSSRWSCRRRTPTRCATSPASSSGVRLALVDEQIAEIKSRLQRTNPVDDADAYLELFGDLVPLEQYRIALREKAMGAVG